MRTGFDSKAASAIEVMADARRLQGAHGAQVIAALIRKLRHVVLRAAQVPGIEAVGHIRLR